MVAASHYCSRIVQATQLQRHLGFYVSFRAQLIGVDISPAVHHLKAVRPSHKNVHHASSHDSPPRFDPDDNSTGEVADLGRFIIAAECCLQTEIESQAQSVCETESHVQVSNVWRPETQDFDNHKKHISKRHKHHSCELTTQGTRISPCVLPRYQLCHS